MKNLLAILILLLGFSAFAQPQRMLVNRRLPAASSGGVFSPVFVQAVGSSLGGSQTVTATVTAGDTIIVFFSDIVGTVGVSAADNFGDTFTTITNFQSSVGFNDSVSAYICHSAHGGSTTVTITTLGRASNSFDTRTLLEYSGVTQVDSYSAMSTADNAIVNINLTTSHKSILLGCSEGYVNTSGTASISAVSWTQRNVNNPNSGYQFSGDWLNGGTGYSASTYTAAFSAAPHGQAVVFLSIY